MDERIRESDDPQHEHEGMLEQLHGFEPRETFACAFGFLFWRRMRQQQAVGRQHQRCDTSDDVSRTCARFGSIAGQWICQDRSQPATDPLRIGGINFVIIYEDEDERPRCENPPNRSAHAHDAELFLRVLHAGESDGIGDGDRWHVEQAMDHHQTKERPE